MDSKNHKLFQLKKWIEDGDMDIRITGLSGVARVFFLAQLFSEFERPSLIILPQAKDANRCYRELEFFLPEYFVNKDPGMRRLYDFPGYDISPLTGLSPHRDIINRRLQSLYALTSQKDPIVVTSVEAILFKIIPQEAIIKAIQYMAEGDEVDRDNLIQLIEENGYLRTSLVEERGDYSVRGGVIDIFPPLYSQPVRLEFWGDYLESIRHFDALTQRSTDHLKEVHLLPASEIIMDRDNVTRARSMGRLPNQIRDVGSFPGQEAWLNHFYSHLDTIFDYLPRNGILILIDPLRIEMEEDRFFEKVQKDTENYRQEAAERESPFPDIKGILLSRQTTGAHLRDYQCINFSEVAIEKKEDSQRLIHMRGTFQLDDDLDVRLAGKGRVSMAPLAEKISGWLNLGSRVVLVCRTEQQAHRLDEILRNYQVKVDQVMDHWSGVSIRKGLSICIGRLTQGFVWPELGIYVISEDEIFGSKRPRAKIREMKPGGGLNWTALSQLKEGDLVVHRDHGIGRYGGLSHMEIEHKMNDFVMIEYAGNDRLFIPADRTSILQKYIGADERNPKLDRLGGRSWDLVKKKAKRSVMEIAKQLVEIYALRKYRKGFAFSPPDNYFREFEATFEHEETPDQIKAIEDVLSDMESERPMDRLVCGDVGFGKTEVAIRASFKAVIDGRQVALLVPTTVLAEQHYETFRERMEPYQVRIGVLSRFKTRTEQKEILAKVRSGKMDILIGTHRILQKDISFHNLGLLIIDEEQRFGVKQKERLKRYRALVDVLALTATPIPRTLHMSLMGVRDLSIIESPPEERLAIQTYLSAYDESTIVHAIESELAREGQIFFVHNRVQSIEHITDRLFRMVPQARFAIAHGQMKEKDLEETMIRFLKKEIDVLVCSTIIESGLDIPSVNTIIINEVDRFGLSQIYQLRGRVGRSKEHAYAYLLLSSGSRITREAEKRLKALMDFSQLGAGIHLAMHDLKIRGGGNILGFTQSGHIAAIGYELYLKLVEQTIAELRGEEWHEEIDPEINVDIPAYLPGDYVSDTDIRLNLYRRLSSLVEEADLKAMKEEMADRFGPPPEEVSNLLTVMAVRLLLKRMSIIRLEAGNEVLIFTFSPETEIDPVRFIKLLEGQGHTFQFVSETKLSVKIAWRSSIEALLEAKRILEEFYQAQKDA